MSETKIEWCDHTINPIRARMKDGSNRIAGHYCEKVSAGCANCYASVMQKRFGMPPFGSGQHLHEVEIFLDESKLEEVVRRKKPTRYFWFDMTDAFGEWVDQRWLNACFAVMDATPHHTHMLLTKRPENILKMWPMTPGIPLPLVDADPIDHRPTEYMIRPNVWLGTSVENQEQADKRIPELLKCRDLASTLFLSCEPLLGPVDLLRVDSQQNGYHLDALRGRDVMESSSITRASGAPSIDWVIAGGESGPNARPCVIEWIHDLQNQCRAAEVPVFTKQFGSMAICSNVNLYEGLDTATFYGCDPSFGACSARVGFHHPKGGDPSEWPEEMRVREWPLTRCNRIG